MSCVELVLDWIRMIIEHNANVFWHSWVCDFRGKDASSL